MRALITGAQGRLAARFIERMGVTDELLALSPVPVVHLGVPCAVGEIDTPGLMEALAPGCETLVHFAPDALRTIESPEAREAATRRLLEAAVRVGIRRLVYVSSAWAPEAGDAAAEALALAGGPLRGVLLQTPLLLGPDDAWGHAAGLLRWALDPTLPALSVAEAERPISFIDERDLQGALEAALHRGQAGRCYPLAGGLAGWSALRDRCRWLAATAEPEAALRLHGPVDLRYGQVGLDPDDREARRDLGWWNRDPDRSLDDAVRAWLRREATVSLTGSADP